MAIRFEAATPPTSPVRKVENATPQAPAEQTLGQQTLGMVLKKASESARAFGDSLTARLDEARKASAREQVAQVRERIQMLKRLILLFGASKALVRELKQLAGQLAAAADVLNEGGGSRSSSSGLELGSLYTEGGTPTPTASPATTPQADQAEGEVLAAEAESDLTTPAQAEGRADDDMAQRPAAPVLVFNTDPQQAQRNADAEQLEKAVRELKALYAMAKASRRNRDRDDQRRLKEIGEHLEQAEKALGQLREPLVLGISVRV